MHVECKGKEQRGCTMQYLPRSSRYRRKRKRVNFKKLGTIITLAVFLVLIFACIRYFSLFKALKGSSVPAIWRPDAGERVQFLLAGRLNNQITSCTLLSVPAAEDSPVYILRIPPSALLGNTTEANDSFAAVYAEQGIEAAVKGLDALLTNKLPVNHYVVYDVQGIAEIVSALEKVKVTLPEGFQVRHENTDYIFAPGENLISADNLIPLIASDSDYGDKAFWAEKTLLVEVFNQLFTLNHISHFVGNMGSISDSYETDLSPRQLARFRDSVQALAWEDRSYSILPGRWMFSGDQRFWSPDQKLIELNLSQIADNIPGYDKSLLVVDIFNGNGISGFAASTAAKLRERNFNTGRVDNAETSEFTRIYYQEGYQLAAMEIALFLDVEAVLIQDRYFDSDNPVAVILGLDLAGR